MSRVIVFVFDGLQKELVTEELMPNLTKFTSTGVRFLSHQPVFPTVTRVNAATMVTGCFPGTHGLVGNTAIVPEFSKTEPMNTYLKDHFLELISNDGDPLLVPTLAQSMSTLNLQYIAIGVGSTGQSFVHHPYLADEKYGSTIHPEYSIPDRLNEEIISKFGFWPDAERPNASRIERMVDICIDYALVEQLADVTFLWCSEPDGSQHGTPLGSDTVFAGVKAADQGFGKLLTWINDNDLQDEFDIIVTCDHGHSSAEKIIPINEMLLEANFSPPGMPNGIAVADNGGALLFYIEGKDFKTGESLVNWLTSQYWSGPVLVADYLKDIPGVLPTSLVGLDGARGPDVALSFAWNENSNLNGVKGFTYVASGKVGCGQHGSMNPTELRTFTVANGPSFLKDVSIASVSGHPDIAPTIMHLLGHAPPSYMEGTILYEALSNEKRPKSERIENISYSSQSEIAGGQYKQQLIISPRENGGYIVSAEYSH
tara:strand:- start:50 stop:1501 length:1452 start_codon:yes stop_codon:yes gene_type:complete